jgi:hypothetical protein
MFSPAAEFAPTGWVGAHREGEAPEECRALLPQHAIFLDIAGESGADGAERGSDGG